MSIKKFTKRIRPSMHAAKQKLGAMRERAADKTKKVSPRRRAAWKLIKSAFLVMLCTALIMFVAFVYYIVNYLAPSVADIKLSDYKMNQTSFILAEKDSKWQEVEQLHSGENRQNKELKDIPLYMQNAAIAIEDQRFRSHHGVDWKRTFGAAFKLLTGNQSFGGSTITQQLIKNVTEEDSISITRKIKEILSALSLEKRYSKDEILENYLNEIFLGENCNGVQMAARTYFNKDVENLTLAECASIIGITQYPGKYDPYLHPDNNKKRQEVILAKMLELGFISQAEYDTAKAQPLVYKRGDVNAGGDTEVSTSSVQSYYTDQVITDVLNDLVNKKGYTRDFAANLLYTGGLKIYSAMDPDIQNAMEKVFTDEKNYPKTSGKAKPEASMVVIDPQTGGVLGLVGGRGEKTGALTLNRVTQTYRQPGSTIKPIGVYAPAIEYGVITEASIYDDTPYDIPGRWPKNYDLSSKGYTGLTTIKRAVGNSINTVAVKVLNDLGIDRSFTFMTDKLHITSLVDSETRSGKVYTDKGSALALGGVTDGISLMELTAAYVPFANKGIYSKPYTYTKVEDASGKVILENKPDSTIAMSEQTAFITNDLLQYAVNHGVAGGAKIAGQPTAGKTGTTTEDKDRWFVGYTPYYVGGVWFGYDTPKEIRISGANPALALWKKVMDLAHKGKEAKKFYTTTNMVQAQYCMDSGEIPTDICKLDPRGGRVDTGWFLEGTEPTEPCGVHIPVELDRATNMIATSDTPQANRKTVGLLNVSRDFPYYISVADAQYTYLPLPDGYIFPTNSLVPVYQNLLPPGHTSGQSPNAKKPMNHLSYTYLPQPVRDSYSQWKGYQIVASSIPPTGGNTGDGTAVTPNTPDANGGNTQNNADDGTPNTDTIPVDGQAG